jgi:hypothetical protein
VESTDHKAAGASFLSRRQKSGNEEVKGFSRNKEIIGRVSQGME